MRNCIFLRGTFLATPRIHTGSTHSGHPFVGRCNE